MVVLFVQQVLFYNILYFLAKLFVAILLIATRIEIAHINRTGIIKNTRR